MRILRITSQRREARTTGAFRERRMDRFRLIEAVKIADRVLPKYGGRALFDVFHSPFPDVAGDYLKSHGGAMDIHIMQEPSRNQDRDPLSRLPLELFELVFTRLTVYELDAARFTCRGRSFYPSIYPMAWHGSQYSRHQNMAQPRGRIRESCNILGRICYEREFQTSSLCT